jgi:hypothetical protein
VIVAAIVAAGLLAGCGLPGEEARDAATGETRAAIAVVTRVADVRSVVIDVFATQLTDTSTPARGDAVLKTTHDGVLAPTGGGRFAGAVVAAPGTYWFYATALDGAEPPRIIGRGVVQGTVSADSVDSTAGSQIPDLTLFDWNLWLRNPDPQDIADPGPVITSLSRPATVAPSVAGTSTVFLQDLLAGTLPTLGVTADDPSTATDDVLLYSWRVSGVQGGPVGSCSTARLATPSAASTTFTTTRAESCLVTVTVADPLGKVARASFQVDVFPGGGNGSGNVGAVFVQQPVITSITITAPAATRPACSVNRTGGNTSCATPFAAGPTYRLRLAYTMGSNTLVPTSSVAITCPGYSAGATLVDATAGVASYDWTSTGAPTGVLCSLAAVVTNPDHPEATDTLPIYFALQ